MRDDRGPAAPPAVAEAVLQRLLPPAYAESIAGDLREEFTARVGRSGRRRAAIWYIGQVIAFRYVALHRAANRAAHTRGSARRAPLLGSIRDVRFAVRSALARPALSGLVVVTIGFAIAATTVVYGVVDGVLLRPLPYPEPERLVQLWQTNEAWREEANPLLRSLADRFPVSYPVFEDWHERTRSYSALGAWDEARAIVTGGERPERLEVVYATSGIFEALGVAPAVGRAIAPAEDRRGAPALAVLSHGYWLRRLGGDPNVRGRTVTADGLAYEVIGVMPRDFYFPRESVEMWLTFPDGLRARARDSQFLKTLGRLRPDASIAAAAAELDVLAARLAGEYPNEQAGVGARIVARADEVVGDVRPVLVLVLSAAVLVLVIASANVANLLLVRTSTRRRELAVRAALGAGTRRLVQTVLTESVVLAAAGGVLGITAAATLLPVVVRHLPAGIPRTVEIALDARVVLFGVAATALAALAAGLAPALSAARASVAGVLRDEARGSVTSRGAARVQNGLVVAEVALAFLLLAATGVLGRSLVHLLGVDPGFERDNLVVAQLELPRDRYDAGNDIHAVADRVRGRILALPGVAGVGLIDEAPFAGGISSGTVLIERPTAAEHEEVNVDQAVASDGYFEALRVPLIAGRTFTPADRGGALPVTVVSRSFAEQHWLGQSAVGRRIKDGGRDSERPWLTVVGVVGDAHQRALDTRPHEKMYTPYAQDTEPEPSLSLVIRTAGDPSSVMAAVPELVRSIDAGVPVARVAAMRDLIDRSAAVPRFRTFVIGALALLAGILAVAGLYGVVAFTVARRTAEIGVRLALGASPATLLRTVLGTGLRLAAIGIAAGGAIALFALRLLDRFVYGIAPTDPLTLAAIALLLLATAIAAAWIPARRAARTDPLVALRDA